MTPENYLLRKLMLPQLKLLNVEKISNKILHYHCEKKTDWEVCRKCPTKSFSIHDHRTVRIRDTKFHTKNIRLIIKKRVNHQKHTYPILPPRKYLNSNVRPYQNILLGH